MASKWSRILAFGKKNGLPAEVYPLLGIMTVAVAGVTAFSIYALATKNDVMVDRKSKIPPWERSMDDVNPKLINLHTLQKLDPQIRQLKDELNAKSLD